MSVASSQRGSGERSVAQVVAEWRERSARGEPVDTEEMLAQIEQAEQAAVRSDSLRASQYPTFAKGDTADESKTPTVSIQPDNTGHGAAQVVAAQNAATLNPSATFEKAASRVKALLREGVGSGARQSGLEDYDVLREIAKGGMGVVYEARQRSLNRVVALKMIKAGQLANAEDVARFYAEAEAAANLRHPNIVAVYEVGRADAAQHYFTMDYVAGPSLLDVVRKQPLSAREAAAYVVKVARAIQFAHDRSVLHRDLKPSNILLGEDGEPRVTDFGLAKRIDQDARLTVAGAVVGTPAYMPPEQARGDTRNVGRAADIYSLGAVLYECVTGRPPFISSSLTEMLQQVLLDDPLPPSRLLPSLPRDYETICLKCLEKEPERRYASAGELADDLERFLRDEPIRARPVSLPERALKFARRKPAWAALWGVSAIAAVVLVVVIVTYTNRLAASNVKLTKSIAEEQKQTRLANDRYDALLNSTYSVKIQKSEDYWTDDPPNLARGSELLDTLVPKAGERDLRGFEWYFLKRLCTPSRRIHRSPHPLEDIVVRDDGSLLVCDNRADSFFAQYRDGQRVNLWKLDQPWKLQVAFSRSGPWCVAAVQDSASRHYEIQLRRWDKPEEDGPVVAKLKEPGFCFTISDDGTQVAYGEPNKAIVVWSVAERKVIHSFAVKVPFLSQIQFSPDGKWILERDDKTVKASSLVTSLAAEFKTTRQGGLITGAAFSPDSERLALTFKDGSVDIHDLRKVSPSDNRPAFTFNVLKFFIFPLAIAYLPGERVALGSANSFVIVVDLKRGVPFVYRGHNASVTRLDFSPDGQTLYSCANDGEVLAWDLSVEDQRAHVVRDFAPDGSPFTYDCLSYSADGRWLAAGGKMLGRGDPDDDPGRLWLIDPATRQIIHRLDTPSPVTTCSFSPDSRLLVYGNPGEKGLGPYYVWNLAHEKDEGELNLAGQSAHSLKFIAANRLVLGGDDGLMRAVTLGSNEIHAWKSNVSKRDESNPRISLLASSADGRWVFSHNYSHLIRLWDAHQGEDLLWSGGHMTPVAMALSARGEIAAWSTPNELTAQSAQLTGFVPSPETRPEGAFALHHRALVFDVRKRKIRFIVSGHAASVMALAISADGSRLASGDSSGILKLWDTATGSELLSMDGHQNGVEAIAFHPGGRQMASIGADGALRIWWTE